MQCPICLKYTKKPTKEHLPFKALYKTLLINEISKGATIKICYECNHFKSIYDQEILALYGHIIDATPANKALKSIKSYSDKINISEKTNTLTIKSPMTLDELALIMARAQTGTGKNFGWKTGSLNADVVSIWLDMVARGAYYFFTNEIFQGTTLPDNRLTKMGDKKDEFNFILNEFSKTHKVNSVCELLLVRKNLTEPALILIRLYPVNKEVVMSFGCFMTEDITQHNDFIKSSKSMHPPNIIKQFTEVKPRNIYEIEKGSEGINYSGGILRSSTFPTPNL